MTGSPVVVDEDFPRPVAAALRSRGFDVAEAVEQPPRGIPDVEQFRGGLRLVGYSEADVRLVLGRPDV